MSIVTLLAMVALALGVVELIRSRGTALLAWAVCALALVHLWELLT